MIDSIIKELERLPMSASYKKDTILAACPSLSKKRTSIITLENMQHYQEGERQNAKVYSLPKGLLDRYSTLLMSMHLAGKPQYLGFQNGGNKASVERMRFLIGRFPQDVNDLETSLSQNDHERTGWLLGYPERTLMVPGERKSETLWNYIRKNYSEENVPVELLFIPHIPLYNHTGAPDFESVALGRAHADILRGTSTIIYDKFIEDQLYQIFEKFTDLASHQSP